MMSGEQQVENPGGQASRPRRFDTRRLCRRVTQGTSFWSCMDQLMDSKR